MVASILDIKSGKDLEDSINKLRQALFTIVNTIAEIRNTNSSSHGSGSRREVISEEYATLIFNSTKTLLEFIITKYKKKSI